jgi:hypothetical protein
MRYASRVVVLLLLASSLAAFPQRSKSPGRGKDGHYHDPNTHKVQPEMCFGTESHPCQCARTKPESCQPGSEAEWEPGAQCMTYCRKNDCHCEARCDKS